tara:strand:+ start:1026 stop:1355 length:330 start_codon:yes stop_codon:yes gene_type:complete
MIRFLIILFLFISTSQSLVAGETDKAYESYINSWQENIILARKMLTDAENSLSNGDMLASCTSQRKASIYGLEATRSRIKAFRVVGDNSQIELLEEGLKKWKALGDFCG